MIEEFIQKERVPGFRQQQLYQALYKEFISSFDELTTWPKELRERAKLEISLTSIQIKKEIVSKDKHTVKMLFQRNSDQKAFESVLMRHRDGRNTVCVSSMIGCPVGCTFCATGKLVFGGNLSVHEIVDQVLYVARLLKKENETITNIVFMGMGEPLLNLDNVLKAVSVFTDPERMAMSMRRITISTSGITSNIRTLVARGYRGRLALSLHAPNQALREKLMPIARKNPLPELLAELSAYAELTNKRISYEYILIDGVNDRPQHARELVQLLGTKLAHVNLIPYNPVSNVPYKRSTRETIGKFITILEKYKLQHTLRVTMGDDIKAACGQLAGD